MKCEVVTVASRPCVQVSRFIKSCVRFGIWPRVLGINQPFNGTQDKFIYFNQWLASNPDATHILFLDSFDVVLAAGLDEIMAAYQEIGHTILFSAEKSCAPDPSLSAHYPPAQTPFRYLNSGCFMGPVDEITRTCLKVSEYNQSDQLTLHQVFLKGDSGIGLDVGCRIFQCLFNVGDELDYLGDRIYNRRTDTCPLVFHGNGFSDMSDVLMHPAARVDEPDYKRFHCLPDIPKPK
jgi:hypothetical protein